MFSINRSAAQRAKQLGTNTLNLGYYDIEVSIKKKSGNRNASMHLSPRQRTVNQKIKTNGL